MKEKYRFLFAGAMFGGNASLFESMKEVVSTTSVVGIRELVDDGETGFVIPPNDEETLAQRLSTLVDDESLRRRFGMQARIAVERRSNLEKSINTIIDHLKKAADGSQSSRRSIVQATPLPVPTPFDATVLLALDQCFPIKEIALCP